MIVLFFRKALIGDIFSSNTTNTPYHLFHQHQAIHKPVKIIENKIDGISKKLSKYTSERLEKPTPGEKDIDILALEHGLTSGAQLLITETKKVKHPSPPDFSVHCTFDSNQPIRPDETKRHNTLRNQLPSRH